MCTCRNLFGPFSLFVMNYILIEKLPYFLFPIISFLLSSLPYRVHWAQQDCLLGSLIPACESIKSRGALISAFSRDGLTLAVTLNQKDPKVSQCNRSWK